MGGGSPRASRSRRSRVNASNAACAVLPKVSAPDRRPDGMRVDVLERVLERAAPVGVHLGVAERAGQRRDVEQVGPGGAVERHDAQGQRVEPVRPSLVGRRDGTIGQGRELAPRAARGPRPASGSAGSMPSSSSSSSVARWRRARRRSRMVGRGMMRGWGASTGGAGSPAASSGVGVSPLARPPDLPRPAIDHAELRAGALLELREEERGVLLGGRAGDRRDHETLAGARQGHVQQPALLLGVDVAGGHDLLEQLPREEPVSPTPAWATRP